MGVFGEKHTSLTREQKRQLIHQADTHKLRPTEVCEWVQATWGLRIARVTVYSILHKQRASLMAGIVGAPLTTSNSSPPRAAGGGNKKEAKRLSTTASAQPSQPLLSQPQQLQPQQQQRNSIGSTTPARRGKAAAAASSALSFSLSGSTGTTPSSAMAFTTPLSMMATAGEDTKMKGSGRINSYRTSSGSISSVSSLSSALSISSSSTTTPSSSSPSSTATITTTTMMTSPTRKKRASIRSSSVQSDRSTCSTVSSTCSFTDGVNAGEGTRWEGQLKRVREPASIELDRAMVAFLKSPQAVDGQGRRLNDAELQTHALRLAQSIPSAARMRCSFGWLRHFKRRLGVQWVADPQLEGRFRWVVEMDPGPPTPSLVSLSSLSSSPSPLGQSFVAETKKIKVGKKVRVKKEQMEDGQQTEDSDQDSDDDESSSSSSSSNSSSGSASDSSESEDSLDDNSGDEDYQGEDIIARMPLGGRPQVKRVRRTASVSGPSRHEHHHHPYSTSAPLVPVAMSSYPFSDPSVLGIHPQSSTSPHSPRSILESSYHQHQHQHQHRHPSPSTHSHHFPTTIAPHATTRSPSTEAPAIGSSSTSGATSNGPPAAAAYGMSVDGKMRKVPTKEEAYDMLQSLLMYYEQDHGYYLGEQQTLLLPRWIHQQRQIMTCLTVDPTVDGAVALQVQEQLRQQERSLEEMPHPMDWMRQYSLQQQQQQQQQQQPVRNHHHTASFSSESSSSSSSSSYYSSCSPPPPPATTTTSTSFSPMSSTTSSSLSCSPLSPILPLSPISPWMNTTEALESSCGHGNDSLRMRGGWSDPVLATFPTTTTTSATANSAFLAPSSTTATTMNTMLSGTTPTMSLNSILLPRLFSSSAAFL